MPETSRTFLYDPATHIVTATDARLAGEASKRTVVIREAFAWLGTPFRDTQQTKGCGCDCGGFINGIFSGCGWEHDRYMAYRADWFRHKTEEMYLNELRTRATEVATPEPGDVALFRFGRVYGHGALVLDWPNVIHAARPHGVQLADASYPPLKRPRQWPVLFFDPYFTRC